MVDKRHCDNGGVSLQKGNLSAISRKKQLFRGGVPVRQVRRAPYHFFNSKSLFHHYSYVLLKFQLHLLEKITCK